MNSVQLGNLGMLLVFIGLCFINTNNFTMASLIVIGFGLLFYGFFKEGK